MKIGNEEITTEPLEIGDYVEYNVEYTDDLLDCSYTAKTGWRVLDPGTRNKNGKYSGVKLISTARPGKFYYNEYTKDSYIYQGKEEIGKWIANDEQKNMYISKLGMDVSKINTDALGLTAGFYYNFDKLGIKFGNVVAFNQAVCTQINDITNGSGTGKMFEIEGISTDVHNLTLEELRNAKGNPELTIGNTVNCDGKAKGLFAMYELTGVISHTGVMYVLATPVENENNDLMVVGGSTITTFGASEKSPGIRPVVTLLKDVYKDKEEWKIEQ